MIEETDLYRLASWSVALQYDDLPLTVINRTKALFLDWLGSALAGRNHVSVHALTEMARIMGPQTGPCDIVGFINIKTSPMFAAMVNAASSHVVEQDDLHNSSMMHPATVVFPAALAVAQATSADSKQFLTACVVGYEFACRFGERLGPSHYKKYHTTATTGIIGATAASAHLLKLDTLTLLSAVGTAGTQAAGLWQFLLDATHSKQVHTAKAASGGVSAAYLAQGGLLGPMDILEGPRGMVATLSSADGTDRAMLSQELGITWSVLKTSFKWHASCRHTHPSVDALLAVMEDSKIEFDDIELVSAFTYKAAIDILALSEKAETVHQSKFSMGFVLAVAARYGRAGIEDFTEDALEDAALRGFQSCVKMIYDQDLDKMFPEQWLGRISVTTKTGETLQKQVDVVKGDPDWTLTRDELETKFEALARYGRIEDMNMIKILQKRVWNLEKENHLRDFACR